MLWSSGNPDGLLPTPCVAAGEPYSSLDFETLKPPEETLLFAQRKAPFTPRSNPGSRYGYRAPPIRARVGLAMRRSMTFGDLPDAEAVLRSNGLSLAPMSVGEAGMNVGGTSVLATAQVSDIDNGALKALIVPAGAANDTTDIAALDDAIQHAQAKGTPVLAFGEGVADVLRALDRTTDVSADAPAVMVSGDTVEVLGTSEALADAARRIQ